MRTPYFTKNELYVFGWSVIAIGIWAVLHAICFADNLMVSLSICCFLFGVGIILKGYSQPSNENINEARELLKDPKIQEFFETVDWVEHRTPEEIEKQAQAAEDRKRKELGAEAEIFDRETK